MIDTNGHAPASDPGAPRERPDPALAGPAAERVRSKLKDKDIQRVWIVLIERVGRQRDVLCVRGTRDSAIRALVAAIPDIKRLGADPHRWHAPNMRAFIRPELVTA